jgi:hypothetical protein
MTAALFDQLQRTLHSEGPAAAIARLCGQLREAREYHSLFYALLMKKRVELGVVAVPTGPAQDLPAELHGEYEEAIRAAAREVGGLFLQAGDLPQAWVFFRMIDEPGPVREALDRHTPGPDEDVQPLVSIAFYEGVHPTKGFDWALERFGLCSAITTVGSGEMPHPDEVKQHCIRALVRALYGELRARLAAEVEARFSIAPPEASEPPEAPGVVRRLIKGRDWLFAEDAYHVDTSHLSSVVQLAMHLKPCPELGLARELCAYGAKLSDRYGGSDDPPFEKGYDDYEVYLSVLAGDGVEKGLDHFRKKAAEADPEEIGTYPAEVLVNLLLKVDRGPEAVEVARRHLSNTQGRQLTCPNLTELCQRFAAYQTLAEVAREQGDAVHYLAGLIAATPKKG